MPAASAAADPPEEPPTLRDESWGLLVRPCSGFSVCPKSPSMKATFVVPTTIAPALMRRRTTVASMSATASAQSGLPQVVGRPATWKASLTVTGSPWSGPRGVRWASAAAAAASRRILQRRVPAYRGHGVDLAVDGVDPLQHRCCQLQSRHLARPQRGHHLRRRTQQYLITHRTALRSTA